MQLNRASWLRELHLSNFINTYYQFRDLEAFNDCQSVLIIGPGQGLETQVLRWRGYSITTFDIDSTFTPDIIGSVHDLSMFRDQQFDAVVASHVLEHLAEPYLNSALLEISRVGRHALIYLPFHGRHFHIRVLPGFRDIDISFVLDFFNYFERPTGLDRIYMSGEHYWELGMAGFRVSDMRKRMSAYFEILRDYRNRDWLPSYNFVLRSKYCSPAPRS